MAEKKSPIAQQPLEVVPERKYECISRFGKSQHKNSTQTNNPVWLIEDEDPFKKKLHQELMQKIVSLDEEEWQHIMDADPSTFLNVFELKSFSQLYDSLQKDKISTLNETLQGLTIEEMRPFCTKQ